MHPPVKNGGALVSECVHFANGNLLHRFPSRVQALAADGAVERVAFDHRLAMSRGRVLAEVLEEALRLVQVIVLAGRTPEEVADRHARLVRESGLLLGQQGERGARAFSGQRRA